MTPAAAKASSILHFPFLPSVPSTPLSASSLFPFVFLLFLLDPSQLLTGRVILRRGCEHGAPAVYSSDDGSASADGREAGRSVGRLSGWMGPASGIGRCLLCAVGLNGFLIDLTRNLRLRTAVCHSPVRISPREQLVLGPMHFRETQHIIFYTGYITHLVFLSPSLGMFVNLSDL